MKQFSIFRTVKITELHSLVLFNFPCPPKGNRAQRALKTRARKRRRRSGIPAGQFL